MNGNGTNIYSSTISGNYADKSKYTTPWTGTATGIKVGIYGVGVAGGNAIGCTITNNRLKDVVNQGIYVHDMAYSTISGNTITGFGAVPSQAIRAGTSDTNTVSHCIFSNNIIKSPVTVGNKGIESGGTVASTYTNNIIDMAALGYAGSGVIALSNTSIGNTITENHITTTLANNYAISSAGAAVDNTISNNRTIVVADGTLPVSAVAGNTVFGNKLSTGLLRGVATLSGGAVVISTTEPLGTDTIVITRHTTGGTAGHLYLFQIVAYTSIEIRSSEGGDTSTVAWEIVH